MKWFQKGSTEPEDYSGGRTAEDIISFINGKTGSQAKIKKAPSSVVELNADNFDSIVMDPSKDVLVEFYAPWCGHCKKLIPDYEKLASAFTTETNIVISKLDADHYKDIAGKYGVSGFQLFFGLESTNRTLKNMIKDVILNPLSILLTKRLDQRDFLLEDYKVMQEKLVL